MCIVYIFVFEIFNDINPETLGLSHFYESNVKKKKLKNKGLLSMKNISEIFYTRMYSP